MSKHILIIVNTVARDYRNFKYNIKQIENYAKERRVDLDIVETKKAADAAAFAEQALLDNIDIIVAAGGDGTIYEIINSMKEKKCPLGIIPIGTSNVFASEMGIPSDPLDAFNLILKERPIAIDIGKVNDKKFIFTAGCGLDSFTIKNLDFKLKNIFGRPSFIFTGIKSFFSYSFPQLTIHIPESDVFEAAYQIIINNIKNYGGNYTLAPNASVFDGLLDILILKKKDVFSNIRYVLSVPFEEHLKYRDIAYYQARKIIIKSESPLPIHLDSEIATSTPAIVEVLPRALDVIIPIS